MPGDCTHFRSAMDVYVRARVGATIQNGPELGGFGSGAVSRQMRPEAAPGMVHDFPAGRAPSLVVSAGQLASLSASSISCLARWNDTPSALPTSCNGSPWSRRRRAARRASCAA